MPLFIAGSVALEPRLTDIAGKESTNASPEDTLKAQRQLEWIVGRLDRISNDLGINWAAGLAILLRSPTAMVYDADKHSYARKVASVSFEKVRGDEIEIRPISSWINEGHESDLSGIAMVNFSETWFQQVRVTAVSVDANGF
ncbi:hypothetical protein MBLNU459_g6912t1 [Dothideomycetes sp. NU459]